ncbi:DUF692 domain-containing protein (plasmid) [Thalassobaculum sp. OXR-137]|uniref:MNIO family bufferin maturase n=1 Tax=Thalassobaculum sp. OXR-137 TaxID=3100173 RepID=UPI002AC8E1FC|nr:DUF692 domain-containing protein [Thalassobaculum sp. OXR-137]WPZ37211.1 DUF692 domain-containing protein [Thalassobaculum sp. OXR-137]
MIKSKLPPCAGICFKPQHWEKIAETAPSVGFFEVHAENYMGAGGPPHRMLSTLRERWPLSLHGVGLSIGGDDALDEGHLARLRTLIQRYRPASFSEHLAWSSHDGVFFNDLLPLPYNACTLARVVEHIDRAQEALGMRILLENPSAYVKFEDATMGEIDFLTDVARRTGCGLLLDVNNAYVSAVNQSFDPEEWLNTFPVELVGEVHLAGHAVEISSEGDRLLIDTHDRRVDAAVWRLFESVIARAGPLPTLIEWDADLPPVDVLLAEAATVERILECQEAPRRDVG